MRAFLVDDSEDMPERSEDERDDPYSADPRTPIGGEAERDEGTD